MKTLFSLLSVFIFISASQAEAYSLEDFAQSQALQVNQVDESESVNAIELDQFNGFSNSFNNDFTAIIDFNDASQMKSNAKFPPPPRPATPPGNVVIEGPSKAYCKANPVACLCAKAETGPEFYKCMQKHTCIPYPAHADPNDPSSPVVDSTYYCKKKKN